MELPLIILYTANIRGNLDLLPRMYTLLRQLKVQPLGENSEVKLCPDEPDLYRTLVLDLGESCSPAVWHCAATGGRSTLIVLDAMGYDAANVSSFLADGEREKLSGTVRLALVDSAHPWQTDGLQILLQPAPETRLDNGVLSLASVQAGQIGVAHLTPAGHSYRLAAQAVFDLSPATPPDATISATVEFVVSEARFYQRKKS